MKTGIGNKVKKTKNNIHNEKGWLALNGLANLYFLFLEKVNASTAVPFRNHRA